MFVFSLFSIMDHTKRRMIIEKLREYILDCFQMGFVNFMWTFCEIGIYEKLYFIFHKKRFNKAL